MTYSGDLEYYLNSVYFSALKGSIYHSLRMKFFDRWHRWAMFVVVLMSSCSLVHLLMGFVSKDFFTALFSFIALAAGTLDIAFSFTNNARVHDTLSNRWGELARRIDDKSGGKITEKDYYSFLREQERIAKDEPLIYIGLDAVAYNFACRSYGYSQMLQIPWYVGWLKSWIKFSYKQFTVVQRTDAKIKKAKAKTPKTKTSTGK